MIIRKEYLAKLNKYKDLQIIKVITGIRRCGKSTLLMQYQSLLKENGVNEERIVSLNFEELENEELLDYKKLYSYLKSKISGNEMTYFFLDEIQRVASYEKVIDSLYVKDNVDIYIAGSNAYLLSSELATLLSGRYVELNLLPLSFKEYKEFMNVEDNNLLFSDYIENGALPYACLMRKNNIGLEDDYVEGIYNTVFVKDIEERQKRKITDLNDRKVADIPLLKNIAKYLSSVIGSPVSMKKIADYFASNGRKVSHVTIDNYIESLEESYLYYKVERMDISGKTILKQNQKYYLVDLGFRKHILSKQKYDVGFSLENIVFLELIRRGYKVNIGKIGLTEVNFVAFKDGIYKYFQVSASILNEETFNREIKPLKAINDNYEKIILTSDTIGLNNYDGIKVINIIEWLLG